MSSRRAPGCRRVLVVDDDPLIRELLRTLLNLEEFEIIEARNGAQALEQAREQEPDLLLLDVSMPDVDGFDVCAQLRADPQLADVGVILLTARATEHDRERGMEAGADAYLTKPFSALQLLRTMEQLPERA